MQDEVGVIHIIVIAVKQTKRPERYNLNEVAIY